MGFGGSCRRSGAARVHVASQGGCGDEDRVRLQPAVPLDRWLRPDVRPSAARDARRRGRELPAYDIERTGENSYRVTLAVAGFKPDDLNVVAQQNMLVVTGERRS